jgi:hypothetical protein
MMNLPPASIRELARRLLAAETAGESASQSHMHEAARVCEKLRVSLTRFAGADGFASLMRRALTLARAEVPSVQNIKVKPDGSLEGIEQLDPDAGCRGAAAVAIATHLLGLLVTFVGESITVRLVCEAWPGTSLDE